MQPADLVIDLQRIVPTEDIPYVIMALRNDPLVWSNVNQPEIMENIFSNEYDPTVILNPAGLSLFILGSHLSAAQLAQDPMLPIENELRIAALKVYEETINNGQSPDNLKTAGLLAIAIRERRRVTQSWEGLLKELTHIHGFTDKTLEVWQTPLACVFGMISDSDQMILGLGLNDHPQKIVKLVSNILFSYPFPDEEQCQRQYVYLERLSTQQRIVMLRQIYMSGRKEVAIRLATRLINNHLDKISCFEEKVSLDDWQSASEYIQNASYYASLYRLSDQPAEAVKILQFAKDMLQDWVNRYRFSLFETTFVENQHPLTDVETNEILDILGTKSLLSNVVLSVDDFDLIQTVMPNLGNVIGNPLVDLVRAGITTNPENQAEAVAIARRAVEELLSCDMMTDRYIPQSVMDWNPQRYIQILLDLNLNPEAIQLATYFMDLRPSDTEIMDLLSHIHEKEGNIAQAVHYSNLCLLLNPYNADSHRRMADLWETSQIWEKSLVERNQVLQLVQEPENNDWLSYIQSAINAGENEQAAVVCGHLLESEPNSGPANRMMGQALTNLGNLPEAILYLNRATLLIPEDAGSWMLLVECYRRENETQRAIETLRAAVLAVPQSLEINFSLAEICLETGSLSEALPFLRKAVSLTPNSRPVTLKLGRTLYLLGYISEACKVYEQARLQWPQDPELAIAYADVLVSMDDLARSIPLFEIALKSTTPNPVWFVNYADVLLEQGRLFLSSDHSKIDYAKLVNAQQALEKALLLQPDDFRAQLLTAEISILKHDYPQASQLYHLLVNYSESHLPEWHWRIQAGIGISARNLGDAETSIAALQEATQVKPQHRMLQCSLAEAYFEASLFTEAFQVAHYALRLAPDDIENLSWFADLSAKMNEFGEAIDALRCITQLAPEEPDYWIRLAECQIQSGMYEDARSSLVTLLLVDNLLVEHYRKVAHLYIQLEDRESAYKCLKLASELDAQLTDNLSFEIAVLLSQLGRSDEALDLIQQSSKLNPASLFQYIFQADLLAWLGRYKAAVACMEHVLNQIGEATAESELFASEWNSYQDFLPQSWLISMSSESHLHARMASWFSRLGEYSQAVVHAEQALELLPDDLGLRLITINLFLAMMDYQKALQYCEVPPISNHNPTNIIPLDAIYWSEIIGSKIGIALENGSDIPYSLAELDGFSDISNSTQLLSIQSRLAVRGGDWVAAQQYYQRARSGENQKIDKSIMKGSNFNGYDLHVETQRGAGLALSEAACDLNIWKDALSYAETYQSQNFSETRANYIYAKILVLCVEKQRLYSELRCEDHAPGAEALSNERFELFEKAITAASKFNNCDKIHDLQIRGRVFFRPLPQNVRELVNSIKTPGDTACLVLILRQLRNCSLGLQLGQKSSDVPDVSLQMALCYQEIDPNKGMEIARQLISITPNSPIIQIVMAQLAEKADQIVEALEVIEHALTIWPEESEWHVWAAQLASQLGKKRVVVSHYELALNLHPDRVHYAVELCRTYLELNSPNKVLELLSSYSRQYPEDANIWLTMAYAYQQLGLFTEALECADLASKIELQSIAPLVLSGEIALEMNNPDGAYQFALTAMKLEPSEISPILLIVKVLERKGKKREAVHFLDQYMEKHNSSAVLYEKARLIQELDGPSAALPLLSKIAENDPTNIVVLSTLAKNQLACGYYQAAEKTINSALLLDPDQNELNLLMGQIKRQEGQLDQAIFYLTETIKQLPSGMDAYMELAGTYVDRREPLQALKIYQQAINIAPNDYRPYYQAGLVMRDYKDYLSAENMLRKAAKLAPSDINIRRHLGAIIALNLVHNSQEVNVLS